MHELAGRESSGLREMRDEIDERALESDRDDVRFSVIGAERVPFDVGERLRKLPLVEALQDQHGAPPQEGSDRDPQVIREPRELLVNRSLDLDRYWRFRVSPGAWCRRVRA